ncbi:alkaline shock response membrane anchor protein AmaP [Tissierella sp. MSJ-40]|uniref:Alkaline shock response membrane anchor protein AmaP n=1 Tax=Tissierella simiarum TaxID=2841534 RepID=A0ABS6E3R6_9FIRM|nr:alkaline shock response membrane anchor protein AmaP [Tissierella simiarum]MBU5437551.1 alkaline shock response membrane anchor protein AmaP [Tissierella simiarum]
MKIIDRLILAVYSLCLAVVSLVIIVIPFDIKGIFSISDALNVVRGMKNNYLYSIIGLAFFIVSIRFLFSGIKGKKENPTGSFLVMRNDHGEVIITSDTIVGLAKSIADRFTGIRNIKTKVDLVEGQIYISMKGEVSSEVNIPEISKELQEKVKDHVEACTGAGVNEVKVEVHNVAAPVRVVK